MAIFNSYVKLPEGTLAHDILIVFDATQEFVMILSAVIVVFGASLWVRIVFCRPSVNPVNRLND